MGVLIRCSGETALPNQIVSVRREQSRSQGQGIAFSRAFRVAEFVLQGNIESTFRNAIYSFLIDEPS